jgi:DNA-binding MarR family transcriptional regulator
MANTDRHPRGLETGNALATVLGFRLRRLQSLLAGHWQRWFRVLDIAVTPVQGGILLLIAENPGISQVMLARLMRIEAPTLLQTLKPLLQAGLVHRYRSLQDGRALALYLTEAGKAVTLTIRAETPAHEDDVLHGLSPDEREALVDLLDRSIASAESAIADLAMRNGAEERSAGRPSA